MKQERMGWQWHQLDHMQIIYTSLQTDNHISTSSLSFYRLDKGKGKKERSDSYIAQLTR